MMGERQRIGLVYITHVDGARIERHWEDVPRDEREAIARELDKRAAEIVERYRRERKRQM